MAVMGITKEVSAAPEHEGTETPKPAKKDTSIIEAVEKELEKRAEKAAVDLVDVHIIRDVLLSGKDYTEELCLGYYGTETEGKKVQVKLKIRALSDYEARQIYLDAMQYVDNKKRATEIYMYGIDIKSAPYEDVLLLLEIREHEEVLVVKKALEDFYPDITIDVIKHMVGRKKVAERVRYISGLTADSERKIHFFLEKPSLGSPEGGAKAQTPVVADRGGHKIADNTVRIGIHP